MGTCFAQGTSEANKRNPKLFYVSSSTATISTTTLCFKSSTALSACARRKKRELLADNAVTDGTATIDIAGVTRTEKEGSSPELAGTKEEVRREGKFFLYWMTTTSTSTSYTATTTSSLRCTPSGFTISNCD